MEHRRTPRRRPYPSDLTDAQWRLLAPLLPPAKPGGRPRSVNLREILNGIFYFLKGCGGWRFLPHDLPPWGTVHYYYRAWRRDGTWKRVHDTLRTQVREAAGREAQPTAGILDSQSVKTTKKGGRVATMPPSRSTGASGTCSSTCLA
jgi:putative transposase